MYVYIYLAIVTCMFNVMKIKKVKQKIKKKKKPFTCQYENKKEDKKD